VTHVEENAIYFLTQLGPKMCKISSCKFLKLGTSFRRGPCHCGVTRAVGHVCSSFHKAITRRVTLSDSGLVLISGGIVLEVADMTTTSPNSM
jgi:hypothetical protein